MNEPLIADERELAHGVIGVTPTSHSIDWPTNLVYQGVTVYAQAIVTTPSGVTSRSNSVPMVIR